MVLMFMVGFRSLVDLSYPDIMRCGIPGRDLRSGGVVVGLGLFVVCANQTSYVIPTAYAGSLDIV